VKINKKLKELNSRIPAECPFCRAKGGTPTLCDMCLGLRELRSELGLDQPGTYEGKYDENGRWKKDAHLPE
jgi:hypothetical protein